MQVIIHAITSSLALTRLCYKAHTFWYLPQSFKHHKSIASNVNVTNNGSGTSYK